MGLRKSFSNSMNRGLTAANDVVNGNFANGTTGWAAIGSTLTALNNVLTVTGNGTTNVPRTSTITGKVCVPGKKVYVKALVKVTDSVCLNVALRSYGSTVTGVLQDTPPLIPVMNTVNTITGILTMPSTSTGFVVIAVISSYVDALTANGKVMEVQEVMAIDLTDLFGAGNEPTKAECDRIFANWFNGTTGLLQTLSPNSPLRN